MAKKKTKVFNLKERIDKLLAAGLPDPVEATRRDGDELDSLSVRVQRILGIFRDNPQTATTMNYMILYDVSNNKVRTLIAKYLLKQGCIRIQKSVFLLHSENRKFEDIRQTLLEINDAYENHDSIILIPLNISDARSMKLIGKNVNIADCGSTEYGVFIKAEGYLGVLRKRKR